MERHSAALQSVFLLTVTPARVKTYMIQRVSQCVDHSQPTPACRAEEGEHIESFLTQVRAQFSLATLSPSLPTSAKEPEPPANILSLPVVLPGLPRCQLRTDDSEAIVL